MKILVICQHYYPENFQVTPICEQLVQNGHEVTVLTGLPNYPLGIIPDEYKKGHRDETVNGVHIIRCHEIARKKGPIALGINYISFYLSAMKAVTKLDKDYDLVFSYQLSPVLMSLPARKYAKKNKVPMVLYCCDLWPESMKMYIKSEGNPLFRFMKRVSRRVYSSADRICCQSKSYLTYLEETHHIEKSRMTYLPAFADESYLNEDFTDDNGVVDFVFLGNLGLAQLLISLLSAVKKIKDVPGFRVHFVGDGTCFERMKDFVKENGMENIVTFYGRRPVEEMPVYYRLADACLVSLRADNATGLALPIKVQGYMAAGKPIFGMIDGSAREVIEESKCGVCVSAGDIDGLAEAMKTFIENKDKFADCGENGRNYFKKNFRKETFMKRLENEFENAVEMQKKEHASV